MYSRILVPVDGSETANLGLIEAIKMAKAQHSTLRLVHVANELVSGDTYAPTMQYERLIESMREFGNRILTQAQAMAREHGAEPQTVLLESIGGRAADMIIEQARQWPADLIVIGTHGRRGLKRLVMGSDAEMILRLSPVPVLMVRAGPKTPLPTPLQAP